MNPPAAPPGTRTRGPAAPARGVRRLALLATGWFCVGLGVLGMALPVLPTTCFLLAAGALFARSSPRANHWLHHNRWFGRYLRDYREGVIPMRAKAVSIITLWATILVTVVVVPILWVRILVLSIATIVTIHVGTAASRRACPAPDALAGEPGPGV